LDCTLNGVHCAAELDENPVTHQLDYPTAMLGNNRLEDLGPPSLESSQSPCLVPLHELAVADDIGSQNSGKAAFSAFFGHPGRRLL
jgi:hypothetical protein